VSCMFLCAGDASHPRTRMRCRWRKGRDDVHLSVCACLRRSGVLAGYLVIECLLGLEKGPCRHEAVGVKMIVEHNCVQKFARWVLGSRLDLEPLEYDLSREVGLNTTKQEYQPDCTQTS